MKELKEEAHLVLQGEDVASKLDDLEDYVYYVIWCALDVIAQAEIPNITHNDDRYVPLEGVFPRETPLESLSTAIKIIASAVIEVTDAIREDSYIKEQKNKIANVATYTILEAKLDTAKPEHQDPKVE